MINNHELGIQWNDISMQRSSLMGIAMISVFLFHSIGEWAPVFLYSICLHGNIGVDIFMFLSALGLSYSLSKNSNIFQFYLRRALRIFPVYWVFMSIVYLFVGILISVGIMPYEYYRFPHSIWEVIQAYTTIGYWIEGGLYYLWYIPAIIVLYVFFPLWYIVISRWHYCGIICLLPSLFIMYCPFQFYDMHLLLIYRIGVFMLGAVSYSLIKDGGGNYSLLSVLFGFCSFFFYLLRIIIGFNCGWEQIIEDVLFYVSLPCILLLLAQIGKIVFLNKILSLVGEISLEFYLIHEFILRFMETLSNFYLHIGRGTQVFWAFLCSLAIAFIVHRMMKYLLFPIHNRNGYREIKTY